MTMLEVQSETTIATGSEARHGRRELLTRVSFLAGGAGLLLAMLLDATAVVGRHVGLPLLGSIELIRACVVIAASSALVGVTFGNAHATIQIVTERLPPIARARLQRASRLLCALFFVWLALGSIWVAADLWHGQEASELLELPFKPLRLFFCASLLVVVLLFLDSALRSEPDAEHP
jgi:TRAP-type C4-dicarboxylate transport system permease small subunit